MEILPIYRSKASGTHKTGQENIEPTRNYGQPSVDASKDGKGDDQESKLLEKQGNKASSSAVQSNVCYISSSQ